MTSTKAHFQENLRIVQAKLRNEPKNYVFKLLKNALMLEHQGHRQAALTIYTRCQHDEFAQSRMKALSRFKLLTDNFTKLGVHLTTDEETVLKSLKIFLKKPYSLTQDALINTLGFSQKRVAAAIESLQFKGYIYRPHKEYQYLEILKRSENITSARTLLFSPTSRQLTILQKAVPTKDVHPTQSHVTYKKVSPPRR